MDEPPWNSQVDDPMGMEPRLQDKYMGVKDAKELWESQPPRT